MNFQIAPGEYGPLRRFSPGQFPLSILSFIHVSNSFFKSLPLRNVIFRIYKNYLGNIKYFLIKIVTDRRDRHLHKHWEKFLYHF